MNLLILNTFDTHGGAAIATYRLHRGLRSIGINSCLLVQQKKSTDQSVVGPNGNWQKILAVLRPYLDEMRINRYPKREKVFFSPAWVPENLAAKVRKYDPDIVHLFWLGGGFFRIETLIKIKQPIIWTLHDMWPFTGGCHYDNECKKFQQSCGNCPVLHSEREQDLSRRVWQRKQKAWESVPITVVATSNWLAKMARSSSIFKNKRIEVIPNGIDTEKYKPGNKNSARTTFSLPIDKKLILFSAFSATTDKRKGNHFLLQALETLSQTGWGSRAELVMLGTSELETTLDLKMKVHCLGYLNDEISQVLLYSAVDVMVAPSTQENLSNAVMESLSCGTPVVAFDIGGMPDMIEHKKSGYLAKPFDTTDLATGIKWVIENNNRQNLLSRQGRYDAEKRYSLKKVANQYKTLYHDVLNGDLVEKL